MNSTAKPSWQLSGATRDAQSITSDWKPIQSPPIHDVRILESRWVSKSNGRLAELFRTSWFGGQAHIDQVFHVLLNGHGISAWHVHEQTIDRLFVAAGQVLVVLFDARSDSPTHRRIAELLLSEYRPQLVVVPAGVWHGVQNVAQAPALIVNMPDKAYDYERPDHWRLPPNTSEIPYSFNDAPAAGTSV